MRKIGRFRALIYALLYVLILQFSLDYLIPTTWVYDYRVDYESIKNDMGTGLDVAMDRISRQIRANPGADYVILLGNSVAYSGPGGAHQSIGYYLEEWSRQQGHPLTVYNLAEPGMMLGDVYAELLMLKEHNIPLNRVLINTVYSDYVPHYTWEPYFGWLGNDLKRLDPDGWRVARGDAGPQQQWTASFRQNLLGGVTLWRDRGFLKARLFQGLGISESGEVTDVRPWTEKPWLKGLMQDPLYQRFVDPHPLDMTESNPAIGLWRKIFAATQGAQVYVFFSPVNHGLLADWTQDPGYAANLKRIDDWFGQQPTKYQSLENALPVDQFTDHVHLLPSGYQSLAGIMGKWISRP